MDSFTKNFRPLRSAPMVHTGKAKFRRAAHAVCLLTIFVGATPAVASAAPAEQFAAILEEVIVTARKRVENLKDVPASVTAFTEEALEDAGIRNMQELSDFTPGFDFAQAFGRQDFRPAIRGHSTILGGIFGAANAGFFIDGFYADKGAPTVPYSALERVEAAKGPQSALYGRNTLAGAINYILKRPTPGREGAFEFSAGEDGELRSALTLSGPLSERLGFMVSLSGYRYDGQYANRFRGLTDEQGNQLTDAAGNPAVRGAGRSADIGAEETLSAIALLEWKPSERTRLTGRLMIEETDDGPYAIAVQPSERNDCPDNPASGGPYNNSGYYCGEVDVEEILDEEYGDRLNLDAGYYDLGLEYEVARWSGTLEHRLERAVLTVNVAWHDYEIRNAQDQSLGPAEPGRGDAFWGEAPAFLLGASAMPSMPSAPSSGPPTSVTGPPAAAAPPSAGGAPATGGPPQGTGAGSATGGGLPAIPMVLQQARKGMILDAREDIEERQVEVRLAAPEDERLRWILGAYWYNFDSEEKSRDSGVGNAPAAGPSLIAAPAMENLAFDAGPGRERDNRAVFAAAEYDLNEALTLGLELRYNEEEVDFGGLQICEDGESCSAADIKRDDFSETYEKTLYRATLDYRWSEDLLFYGAVARGNKPGTFNIYPTHPLLRSQVPVKESTAIMYELGVRAGAWEDRLQLAAAVYETDWEDQQLTLTASSADGQGTISILDNLGETKIQGLELELQARPADFWDLRLTYAWTDTEIEEYDITPYAVMDRLGSGYREAALIFGQSLPADCAAAALDRCPAVDASGGELPQVSKDQFSLSNTFYGSLENGMEWSVRLDWLYRSKRWAQIYNRAHTGAGAAINLRAGLTLDALAQRFMGGGSLEVGLWVRNLTDDWTSPALVRYVEGPAPNVSRAIGFTLPAQRRFGADFTYRF